MFWDHLVLPKDKVSVFHHEAVLELTIAADGGCVSADSAFARQVSELHRNAEAGFRLTLAFTGEESREAFLRAYAEAFEPVLAAGGRVWAEGAAAPRLLLIHRRGCWDLPKGKTEAGENLTETALREVEEETGLRGARIIAPLPTTLHIYPEKGRWAFKASVWFDMAAPAEQELRPQAEEDIHAAVWVDRAALTPESHAVWPSLREMVFKVPAPAGLG